MLPALPWNRTPEMPPTHTLTLPHAPRTPQKSLLVFSAGRIWVKLSAVGDAVNVNQLRAAERALMQSSKANLCLIVRQQANFFFPHGGCSPWQHLIYTSPFFNVLFAFCSFADKRCSEVGAVLPREAPGWPNLQTEVPKFAHLLTLFVLYKYQNNKKKWLNRLG